MKVPFFPDYQLANPWWLLLLLALPLLAWLRGRAGDAPAMAFPTLGLLKDLGSSTRSRSGGLALSLLFASLFCGIVGMARPQQVLSYDEVKADGIGIVVACDVSLSMLIQDFYISGQQVNRLTAAKRVLMDFIKGRPNDRIGIVAFAGAPYHPCPPTLDHEWLLKNMDRIQTGIMEDGTAIGSGIAAAAKKLDQQDIKTKVMVVLTDGANNSGKLSPQDAARLAATLGVKIYTVSIGTPGMHLIRMPNGQVFNSGRQEFDPDTLREVAQIGNGAFYRAEDLSALELIFKKIDEMEKSVIQARKVVETKDVFAPFVLAGIVFAGAYLIWKQSLGRTSPAVA
ncbi:VWA domain-containing protein [Phragmitibacter flavus]|uniref:VWA domain-containing protein n=1 Tax=Phragmitibacter flavus TaxID=2576071 RepID=A0A5R8KIL5_9BACT|nr:VWA domain-containing protein [Phragmitibacter flavus]TLD72107.1 VWA domain-containing protein [Phragmitibacter flavus]